MEILNAVLMAEPWIDSRGYSFNRILYHYALVALLTNRRKKNACYNERGAVLVVPGASSKTP
jgi:hypothetical protein